MHELQIAKNIIAIVEEELLKAHILKPVDSVQVVCGKMRAIIPESLSFNFDVLKKNNLQLENSTLSIRETDVEFRCKNCRHRQNLDEPIFVCEKCSSSEIEVTSGNELFVDNIEFNE